MDTAAWNFDQTVEMAEDTKTAQMRDVQLHEMTEHYLQRTETLEATCADRMREALSARTELKELEANMANLKRDNEELAEESLEVDGVNRQLRKMEILLEAHATLWQEGSERADRRRSELEDDIQELA